MRRLNHLGLVAVFAGPLTALCLLATSWAGAAGGNGNHHGGGHGGQHGDNGNHHGGNHQPSVPPITKGKSYAPGKGKIYNGVSDTGITDDYNSFKNEVNAHVALLQSFYHWDTPLTTGAFARWGRADARGVLSLSTAPGGEKEMISPQAIARGKGDRYLLRLNESIHDNERVTYIRFLPEPNGAWNPYCAFDRSGRSRGKSHSSAAYRAAWQRAVVLVRGGEVKKIQRQLKALDLSPLRKKVIKKVFNRADTKKLPLPKVSFIWAAETVGTPNLKANRPDAYYPGDKYVDWVGADIYSKWATTAAWTRLNAYYKRHDGKPFAITEYSAYDNDFNGNFVRRLHAWARTHRRTQMMLYYRDIDKGNHHNIGFYPGAKEALQKLFDNTKR